MGSGRFVAPKTIEVSLNDSGTRVLVGDKVFINVGTRTAIPTRDQERHGNSAAGGGLIPTLTTSHASWDG